VKIAVTDTGKSEKQLIYMDWLQSYSPDAELVIASHKDSFSSLSGYDALVLTGGEDVDPALSKATPVELVQRFDRARDDFEFRMIEQALKQQIPVLGICRGMQVANVFFGGTLIADLPSAGYEQHTAEKHAPELRHSITIAADSMLKTIVRTERGEVNSYHHQSILRAADGLRISGHSSDRVAESMEWDDPSGKPFLLLVQWHPERMKDRSNPMASAIASALCTAAQEYNSMK